MITTASMAACPVLVKISWANANPRPAKSSLRSVDRLDWVEGIGCARAQRLAGRDPELWVTRSGLTTDRSVPFASGSRLFNALGNVTISVRFSADEIAAIRQHSEGKAV